MTFSPVIVGSGFGAFRNLQNTQAAQTAALAAAPDVSRDIEYFKANLPQVDSIDDLLNDRTLLRVALGAFGLDEDIDNRGFLRRVLESDLNNSASVANRLSDTRYLALAQAFNFQGETAQLPGADPVADIQRALQNVPSIDDLFDFQNEGLLDRALDVFGLTDQKDRTVFLKQVLASDVEDPNSLANRLGDTSYIAFARAFQGKTLPLPADFLDGFDVDTQRRLQTIAAPSDLVRDPVLLGRVLNAFDIDPQSASPSIVLSALESDANDPNSFVNQLKLPGLADLSAAFDFFGRTTAPVTIYDFAEVFEGRLGSLNTVDDLLDQADLLQAGLRLFGVGTTEPDKAVLREILTSDLSDPLSAANSQSDPRLTAFSKAFAFGEIAAGASREAAQLNLELLIERAAARSSPVADPDTFLGELDLVLAVKRVFDLPDSVVGDTTLSRTIRSDPSNAFSVLNVVSDPRYEALYNSLGFSTGAEARSYPTGFVDAIADDYVERQFEVRVGQIDPDMRIALSLSRELGDIVDRVRSNDGRWFSVLGAPPLREAFETALNLPSGLGALDLDRQLEEFKSRAEAVFGTSELGDIVGDEMFDTFQSRYLQGLELRNLGAGNSSGVNNPFAGALALFRGGGG